MNFDDNSILATQIRDGDKNAFRQFYNLYSKRIYSFALSYLRSHSDAEELVQAVFVRIWETRNDIRENLSLQSYLYRITINHIYNLFKYKKVRSGSTQETNQENPDNSTLESIYFTDLQENLNTLIEKLPEQRKIIFKLSRIEGLSHEEIALRMQISVRTVEGQIYKALKFLKKNIREDLFLLLFVLTI